jgi:hypothetical protein
VNSSPVPIVDSALQGNNFSFGNGIVGVGSNATGVYVQSGTTNGFGRTPGRCPRSQRRRRLRDRVRSHG